MNADEEEAAPPRIGIQLARFGAKAIRLYDYDDLAEEAESDEVAESCRLAVAATRAQGPPDPQRLMCSRSIPEDGPPPRPRSASGCSPDSASRSRTTASSRYLRGRVRGSTRASAQADRRSSQPARSGAVPGARRRAVPKAKRSSVRGAPPIARPDRRPSPRPGISYSALAVRAWCQFYAERAPPTRRCRPRRRRRRGRRGEAAAALRVRHGGARDARVERHAVAARRRSCRPSCCAASGSTPARPRWSARGDGLGVARIRALRRAP